MINVVEAQDNLMSLLRSTYDQLVRDAYMLECLRNHGVDDWEYYDDAMDDYEERYPI